MIPRQPSATPLGVAGPRSHLRPQIPSPIAEPAGNGSFAHCKIEEQASTIHRKTNNFSRLKSTDKTNYGVAVQWLNLGEQNWMAMHRAEIVGHPANAQPQHPRGQVRRAASGQDEEPSVVGDEVKAAKLLLGQPPDPPVTGLELERAGVPADEREPVLAKHRDVAHASPDQPPERQIVVRGHQRIPAAPLARAHRRADRDFAQSSSNRFEHRLRRS